MAMGRRKDGARTPGLWIATNELPATGGQPFYQRLNQVLDTHAFDAFVEEQCAAFYASTIGRPSLMPGTYFRLLLIGYFEGIDSERGIAWRTADSLALRGFLGLGLDETPPEHSTISRTRRLIDVETHRAVFTWILQVLATADLIKGKTIGIDATTLEANAALRSIVRRDSGETYQEFLTRLAQASGIETPTRADLARLDRTRPKKGRNKDWRHPHAPDARITKMKDGRTHLAHKAEHAVDLETGAIVGVTVQGADQGDTTTIAETLTTAAEDLEAVATVTDGDTSVIDEVVADKGYHSKQVLVDLTALDLRTYIAEPARGRRRWTKKAAARAAVYANRRRIRGTRGLALQRRRGGHLERPNAHLYETGAMRRTHLCGHANILKRLLVQTGACNLGLCSCGPFSASARRAASRAVWRRPDARRRTVGTRCRRLAPLCAATRRLRAYLHTAPSFRTPLGRRVGNGPFNHGLLGPAIGGVLIATLGVGWAYLFNAISFLCVLAALLMMREVPAVAPEGRSDVSCRAAGEGLRFVFASPVIRSTMLFDFVATFFASATVLLPIFAQDILHVGANGYGWLYAAPAAGALLTSLVMVRIVDRIERQGLVLLWSVALYSLATVVFGVSHAFWLTFGCLAMVGAADTVGTVLRNVIRQLATPDRLRGRMTSINMVFFMGGPQLGELEAGLLAHCEARRFR